MKAYFSIIRLRFVLLLQYRAAAAAGIFTQFFFGLVRVMVMEAFFLSGSQAQPMSFEQTVSYVWLGQAMLGMLPWNGDGETMNLIRTGNVAYELCRPLDLYNHWYCRLISLRIVPTLLRAVPLFLVTMLLLPGKYALKLPASGMAGTAWAVSTLGALLLGCAISNIINISALWTVAGDGLLRLLPAVVMILSGMTVPLAFFPDWMQPILRFLPFSGLVDIPFRFYTGSIPPSQVIPLLFQQLCWTFAIVLFGRWLVSLAMKRVVVQGG